MTEAEEALRAALEAAGLSVQAIPEEQRAMFTPLTDEEVSRLIRLCAGKAERAGGQAEKVGGTGGAAPEGSAPSDPASSEP